MDGPSPFSFKIDAFAMRRWVLVSRGTLGRDVLSRPRYNIRVLSPSWLRTLLQSPARPYPPPPSKPIYKVRRPAPIDRRRALDTKKVTRRWLVSSLRGGAGRGAAP